MASTGTRVRRVRKRKKRDWASISVEQFMAEDFSDRSDEEDGEQTADVTAKKKKTSKKNKSGRKTQLSSLKDKDTEFYEYLKENDPKLLEFDMMGEEREDGSNSSEDEDVLPEPVPPSVSSYASKNYDPEDDSSDAIASTDDEEGGVSEGVSMEGDGESIDQTDEDEEEEVEGGVPVTIAMVKAWVRDVKQDGSLEGMKSIVSALHAGVLRMAGQNTGEQVLQFRVEDGEVFNTLLVATLKHLNSFLDSFLKLKKTTGRVNPTSSSEWTRVKIPMKTYTSDLMTLLTTLSDTSMLSAILKQIFSLSQYYILYPRTMTGLMKRLVVCWSEGEEEVRILAFLNIRKFTLLQSHPALTKILKRIYLAFVRNCKLTTPSTLPAIHLMEHSIVELCRIDPPTTYRHAFVYIRQLAIHLRSALSSKNKDAIQPISNWQYLHCVELWTAVLTDVQHDSLQPLVFPLVQITLGMLQLLKANKFAPLRLHCLALLLQLCEKRGVFIPVAPHLLSIMQIKMSSKTHSSGQLMGKPLDLSCMIKLSVVQLDSKSVQSSILDRSYELLLEYFVVHSHRISFPECSLPTLIELRKIAKETQFSWFKRQIKQLIEKVEAVSSEVERSRSSVQFAPKDLQQVGIWERERKGQPNGLKTFLLSWKQIHQKQMNHEQEAAESSTSTKEKDVQRKSGNMQAKKKNEIGVPKPGLKKKAQPGLKKKAQPGLKKKAQPSLKKEDQPSLKKKDQSGLKKKTQPEEDIVTDMFPL